MNKVLSVLDERIVLGKEFKMYGTIDSPLFLARDVAKWIDHTDTSMMMKRVNDDEKLIQTIFVSGQLRDLWFITEEGLYDLLMHSRKPLAKKFQREVKKILKQIRLTGGYITSGREQEMVENYFGMFSDDIKLSMVRELQQKNARLQEFYDDLMTHKGCLT